MTILDRTTRLAGLLGITLAVALILFAAPSGAANEVEQDSLTFNAVAQHGGTGGSGQTQIILTFTRWSTEEERDELEQILINDGMQALADKLRTAPEVGFIRAPTMRTTSWRLRYAIMFYNEEGQRVIRAAADRPVSFAEANQRTVRTWDFNLAIIELTIDEEGNGEGTIRSGVELIYEEDTDSFLARNRSSQPIRLNNVRLTQ